MNVDFIQCEEWGFETNEEFRSKLTRVGASDRELFNSCTNFACWFTQLQPRGFSERRQPRVLLNQSMRISQLQWLTQSGIPFFILMYLLIETFHRTRIFSKWFENPRVADSRISFKHLMEATLPIIWQLPKQRKVFQDSSPRPHWAISRTAVLHSMKLREGQHPVCVVCSRQQQSPFRGCFKLSCRSKVMPNNNEGVNLNNYLNQRTNVPKRRRDFVVQMTPSNLFV